MGILMKQNTLNTSPLSNFESFSSIQFDPNVNEFIKQLNNNLWNYIDNFTFLFNNRYIFSPPTPLTKLEFYLPLSLERSTLLIKAVCSEVNPIDLNWNSPLLSKRIRKFQHYSVSYSLFYESKLKFVFINCKSMNCFS